MNSLYLSNINQGIGLVWMLSQVFFILYPINGRKYTRVNVYLLLKIQKSYVIFGNYMKLKHNQPDLNK